LVSLVFLHTFFGLAQFCKRPCNPVFDVLQFFKNDCTGFCVASVEIEPTTFPAGNVALTSGKCTIKQTGELFSFLIYSRSKVERGNFLKTLRQSKAVLRRAALSERKQRRTELVGVFSVPPILDISTCNKCFNHGTWFLQKY
jgi:hypothetical protein